MTPTLSHRQLKMKEPRLFEDFRLADSSPNRIQEITVVESAYDSVLCRDFTYVSTPITSGIILYKALADAGLTSVDTLKEDKVGFYKSVILPNIQAAESVAQTMLGLGGAVIAPAVFEAKSLGWSQDDYMGLWLDTIERKATRVAMVDGWEYSNGGCEEYLQALLMQAGRRDRNNITIVDAQGQPISHIAALELIMKAVKYLTSLGFSPTQLVRVLHRCLVLHSMVANESDYGIGMDTCGRTSFQTGQSYNDAIDDKYNTPYVMRAIWKDLSNFSHLIPLEYLNIKSSLDLYPGFVRRTDREELITTSVRVRKGVQDETS